MKTYRRKIMHDDFVMALPAGKPFTAKDTGLNITKGGFHQRASNIDKITVDDSGIIRKYFITAKDKIKLLRANEKPQEQKVVKVLAPSEPHILTPEDKFLNLFMNA